jgi:hypothetical protein
VTALTLAAAASPTPSPASAKSAHPPVSAARTEKSATTIVKKQAMLSTVKKCACWIKNAVTAPKPVASSPVVSPYSRRPIK